MMMVKPCVFVSYWITALPAPPPNIITSCWLNKPIKNKGGKTEAGIDIIYIYINTATETCKTCKCGYATETINTDRLGRHYN